jgi:hypothetical protein
LFSLFLDDVARRHPIDVGHVGAVLVPPELSLIVAVELWVEAVAGEAGLGEDAVTVPRPLLEDAALCKKIETNCFRVAIWRLRKFIAKRNLGKRGHNLVETELMYCQHAAAIAGRLTTKTTLLPDVSKVDQYHKQDTPLHQLVCDTLLNYIAISSNFQLVII